MHVRGRNVLVVGDGDFSFSKTLVECDIESHDTSLFATSVLHSYHDLLERHANVSSAVVDNIELLESKGIKYYFGVDALNLSSTMIWTRPSACDSVIWTYPYPETGNKDDARLLIDGFFKCLSSWPGLSCDGVAVLGLASWPECRKHAPGGVDWMLHSWGVEEVADNHGFRLVSSLGPMPPFWRPITISGKPIHKLKAIKSRSVAVKFYSFRKNSTSIA